MPGSEQKKKVSHGSFHEKDDDDEPDLMKGLGGTPDKSHLDSHDGKEDKDEKIEDEIPNFYGDDQPDQKQVLVDSEDELNPDNSNDQILENLGGEENMEKVVNVSDNAPDMNTDEKVDEEPSPAKQKFDLFNEPLLPEEDDFPMNQKRHGSDKKGRSDSFDANDQRRGGGLMLDDDEDEEEGVTYDDLTNEEKKQVLQQLYMQY